MTGFQGGGSKSAVCEGVPEEVPEELSFFSDFT
jgi:hypothetical protein